MSSNYPSKGARMTPGKSHNHKAERGLLNAASQRDFAAERAERVCITHFLL